MRESIKVRAKLKDGQAVAFVGPTGEDGKVKKTAYNVEYGHRMVTGGKSHLGADGVFRGGGTVSEEDVPPHPFLRPAFEASAQSAFEAIAVQLREELKGGI